MSPAYQASPFPQRSSLIPGVIGFSFGSFNTHDPGSRFQITSVAINGSNVATIAVELLEGFIPTVGSLISIQGTQTATSGGAPNFNVTNVAIASVSINANTGIGTITFALVSNTIATTPDAGEALVPPPIVLEALPVTATAGKQFAVSPATNASANQRGVSWFTIFSGSPSTVTINLQGADVDQDSAYTTIDSSSVATGESRSLSDVNYAFYRIQAASTGGSSPKIAAGITLM
jgi:hypothetical protein